ncbi:MAG: hypothetical protein ACR2QO_18485 [Acidimicrobiales bacterium]
MDRGSTLLGFIVGFFLGCIGLVLVMFLSSKPDTRSGAWFGFIAQIVVAVVAGATQMM